MKFHVMQLEHQITPEEEKNTAANRHLPWAQFKVNISKNIRKIGKDQRDKSGQIQSNPLSLPDQKHSIKELINKRETEQIQYK